MYIQKKYLGIGLLKMAHFIPTTERAAPSIEVYVSAVSSPSRFWVQFVGPQTTQLDELVTDMTEYYGKKENRDAHAVSTIVSAIYWPVALLKLNHLDPNK